ncbi:unnamed protein product [Meloidogyne enterolobii]|uniref:Uncharacterized protein n=1 Tax=Meloidogyne enterolobii TaxID=390850 RepID=A0ACB0YA59_MELEN
MQMILSRLLRRVAGLSFLQNFLFLLFTIFSTMIIRLFNLKFFSLKLIYNQKTTSTPRLVPFPVKKKQQNGQRLVPFRMQINTRQKQIGRRIKIPLKYTNSTKVFLTF